MVQSFYSFSKTCLIKRYICKNNGGEHSKDTVGALSTMITKTKRPKKLWVDTATEFAGDFNEVFNTQRIKKYLTMSETKVPYAERTIRSKKLILYCYMEDPVYKYVHIIPQFIKIFNSRRNCSNALKAKDVKSSNFLFNL